MTLRKNSDISGLQWFTVSGTRTQVFEELGRVFASKIVSVLSSMPEKETLQTWKATPEGARTIDRLYWATEESYTQELKELESIAKGCGLSFEDLFLANIRGDIGIADTTGCTDILWHGKTAIAAHNEDGSVGDNLTFLTLNIEGEPQVFTEWYPGFLPSNAYSISPSGLAWGINHIPVRRPGHYAGRHFVARKLQHFDSLSEATQFLHSHPMAGGFAFNFASATERREMSIECAAGQTMSRELGIGAHYGWHTNHLLYLSESCAHNGGQHEQIAQSSIEHALGPLSESIERANFLENAKMPTDAEKQIPWLFTIMSQRELPHGVFRTARNNDPLRTLCTTILDLDNQCLHIRGHRAAPETKRLSSLFETEENGKGK